MYFTRQLLQSLAHSPRRAGLRSRKHWALGLLMLLLLLPGGVWGQFGNPLMQSYQPVESIDEMDEAGFSGYTTLLQARNQLMYLGLDNQLIEYNGQTTREVYLPSILLSMAEGNDGTLYLGLANDFGRLVTDSKGGLNYQSLASDLPGADTLEYVISQVFSLGDELVFFAENALFRYRPGAKVKRISLEAGFAGAFLLQNRLYVLGYDETLYTLTPQGLKRTPTSGTLPEGRIRFATAYDKTQVLLGNSRSQLFLTDGKSFRRFAANNPKLDSDLDLVDARVVGNRIALASNRVGCILLEKRNGELTGQLSIDNGLPENTTRGLWTDAQQTLWILQSQSLTRVYVNLPLEDFQHVTGLRGNVNQLVTDGAQLYASTEAGLFHLQSQRMLQARLVRQTYTVRKPVAESGAALAKKGKTKSTSTPKSKKTAEERILTRLKETTATRYVLQLNEANNSLADAIYVFQRVAGITERCLDLQALPGGGLIACTGKAVYEVRNGRVEATTSQNARLLAPSKRYPGTVYAATGSSVYVLTRRGEGWNELLTLPKAKGIVSSLAEDGAGNLWVGTDEQIVQYLLEDRLVNQPTRRPLGIRLSGPARLFRPGQLLYAVTDNRLIRIDPIQRKYTEARLPVARLRSDAPVAIMADGTAFVVLSHRSDSLNLLLRCRWGKGTQLVVDTLNVLRLMGEKVSLLRADEDGSLWAAGQSRIVRLPKVIETNYRLRRSLQPRWLSVLVNRGDQQDSLALDGTVDLPSGQYIFHLQFALGGFDRPGATRYQLRFTPEGPWVDLDEPHYTHVAQSEGRQYFILRAVDALGNVSPELTYTYFVAPPFYRRWYFYLLLLLLGAGVVVAVVRYRERAIQTQKAELEAEVARRTAQVNEQNSQLVTQNETLERQKKTILATQDALIQSEKMAVLGQIVANVAHEINNSLAAIRTSGQFLEKDLPHTIETLPTLLAAQTPEIRALLYRVFQLSAQVPKGLSTAEKREMTQKLEAQLIVQQVPDADYYARQLVDAGFHEQLSELLPLLKAPNSEELMKMVIQVGSLMRYVASIRISSERTQKIVHMLKTQSHINLEEKPEPVDLVKSLDTVLEFRRHDLGKIEVIREYQPNLPTIQGFDDELAQVWTNLIVNAIHAMESEGRLTLGLHVEGNHVKVSITDSGKGIPPEVQARIFDPFFTTKPKGVGTGQGLPICQRILERHHGSLYLAHSHPGETTFVALLPLQSPS